MDIQFWESMTYEDRTSEFTEVVKKIFFLKVAFFIGLNNVMQLC